MALLPWQTAVVESIDVLNNVNWQFNLSIEGTEEFNFEPGQFITIDLPIHENKNKRIRSYSIASAPFKNKIELCIVLAENGLGTNYLFNNVKAGSLLTLRGPMGHFCLSEEIAKEDIFLICTGTGVAPFRSMLKHYLHKNYFKKNVTLIFGCRTKTDLLYYKEFKELENTYQNFKYIPTLSREDWEGKKGYVHEIYKENFAANGHYFLCGWKNMIDEARNNLTLMGVDKKQIHFELYG